MAYSLMFLRFINKCSIPVVRNLNLLSAIHWQCFSTQLLARRVGHRKHSHPCLNQFTLPQNQISSDSEDSEQGCGPNLNYEDICKLKKTGEIILIDVRDPYEIHEVGNLPDSINIPLKELQFALQVLSDQEFKIKYGIPKPTKNAPLVFSCAAGSRSRTALQKATEMGYNKARHYKGGFTDWKKKCKKI